jgi:hypothetical protein
MREWRECRAGLCFCAVCLGVNAETMMTLRFPVSDCVKAKSVVTFCQQETREIMIPPHLHNLLSTSSGTPWVYQR